MRVIDYRRRRGPGYSIQLPRPIYTFRRRSGFQQRATSRRGYDHQHELVSENNAVRAAVSVGKPLRSPLSRPKIVCACEISAQQTADGCRCPHPFASAGASGTCRARLSKHYFRRHRRVLVPVTSAFLPTLCSPTSRCSRLFHGFQHPRNR